MDNLVRSGNYRRRGWIVPAGVVAGLVVAGLILSRSPERGVEASPAEAAPAAACNESKANAAFTVAKARGVIRGVDMSRSEGVVVLVSPARFRALGMDGQKALAARLDCGIAGQGGHLVAMHFRQDRSGADLYGLKAVDLLELRRAGFAN